MKRLFRSPWLALAVMLLAGCQSPKAVLLPPTPLLPAAPPATGLSSPARVQAPVLLPVRSRRAGTPLQPELAAKSGRAPHPFQQFGRVVATPAHRAEPAHAVRRPQLSAQRETGHLLLGLALLASGVVVGLLLGGWLGLGVGVLVVLLGYYFLGLAFGGQHAWQEVFQEFFNM